MRTRIAAIAAVGAIAIAGAGCGGGDDDSSSSSTPTPTKDEFVTQANQICAEGNETVDAAANDVFSGQPTQDELDSFITDTVIPNTEDQIEQIRALGIPAGDEDQVNAILDSAQSDLDAAKADPSIMTSGSKDPFAETNKLAAAYGLTECASG
jgi:hypothetical protein